MRIVNYSVVCDSQNSETCYGTVPMSSDSIPPAWMIMKVIDGPKNYDLHFCPSCTAQFKQSLKSFYGCDV